MHKILDFINIRLFYILNPLDFCSLCTELRRFCLNFSHCSANHCLLGLASVYGQHKHHYPSDVSQP